MDTHLHHFCNRELAAQIRQLRDRNVLLLLIDGSAVFGRMGRLEGNLVNVIPATGIAGVNAVRFRPPNPTLPSIDILVSEFIVDVCDIGMIIEGPFICSPISETGRPPQTQKHCPAPQPKTAKLVTTRQQTELIRELEEFEGQNIGVLLTGGWAVGGQLGEVFDCTCVFGPGTSISPLLISLGVLNILGPALVGGIQSLPGTFRAWVNLKALTGVLIP